MSLITANFQTLWNNYPNGDSAQVKQMIGGHVNAAWITNTCVIRASRAFNATSDAIPGPAAAKQLGLNVVSGNDKKWYGYRVSEFHNYMIRKYGPPISVSPTGEVPQGILGKKGIIEFVVAFSDATGHFDVWNGAKCRHQGYFNRASVVHLWT